MQAKGVNELRSLFLKYFEKQGHLIMKSASLVPHNDNSLLLINSGMAPLKPYFTGQEIPPRNRVTTCQKCIRTGDIDNVGKTARHGTFFEMLGNFSFGDYFKHEAIPWAWEFLTEVVGLDPDRLYPSVYVDDDEAFAIWRDEMHIDPSRIYKFGKEDNFWEHGSGPCGPCSEIYYDRGEKWGNGPEDVMGGEGDRFIEVWNIVFSQFDNDGHGNYSELEHKNIDTGMGLERLAMVVQDEESIYTVDTNRALLDGIARLSDVVYHDDPDKDISLRILTDHTKAATFMISDGIMPSNEGRGYVLRRIIRRAVRHGRKLGIHHDFMTEMSEIVISHNADGYPELEEKREMILKVLAQEEDKFNRTIDAGSGMLSDLLDSLKQKGQKTLSGADAFRLYDTYGFPYDLTEEICRERGIEADKEGFDACMKEQKETARAARKTTNYMGADASVYDEIDPSLSSCFTGYETLKDSGKILVLTTEEEITDALTEGQKGTIVTDITPFYGTMGGQEGDCGIISNKDGEFRVTEAIHLKGGRIGHVGIMTRGMLSAGSEVSLEVDAGVRKLTMKNHSATHLLQAALRQVLGSHVMQSGAFYNRERLRFDFTHFAALSRAELKEIERLVNKAIQDDLPVVTEEMSLEEARKSGAMALFDEKYGDVVRVVKMGDFSIELCGGTHVSHTGIIGSFKIVSESGIAAGVRRVEGLVGENLTAYYEKKEEEINEAAELLKAPADEVCAKIRSLQEELKKLRSENEKLKAQMAGNSVSDAEKEAVEVNGLKILAIQAEAADVNALRSLSDQLKDKLGSSVVILASVIDGKVTLLANASEDAVKKGINAGLIIKESAGCIGGKGGGRPNMAQAGGNDPSGIEAALEKAAETAKAQV